MTEIQQIVRILLRYGAMALMSGGYLSAEAGAALTDPAMLTALSGVIVAAGTEIWFWAAKRV